MYSHIHHLFRHHRQVSRTCFPICGSGTMTLCLSHEGNQKPPSCLNQVVTHLQASSFDWLEHAAVRRVLLVNSVQEIHFDDVLWNGVLETVKHLAPITQCHILLVQLGSKQKHSCGEPQKTSLSQLTINGPNGTACQGLVCQHSCQSCIKLSPSALPSSTRDNWPVPIPQSGRK